MDLPVGDDAWNPPFDDWEMQFDEAIDEGDNHFEIDVTVTWEQDGEFHTEVIHIEFDADTWREFESQYYHELRDILDSLGVASDEMAITG
jgi:hypothetical protein